MGFGDLFGPGKKEKIPFKVPTGISELRTRIETECRERYPSLARYNEILKNTNSIYHYLNTLIKKNEHAEEAIKIKEDIRKKLEGLETKIKVNREEAKKEGKQDYIEKNIDYLERKSMRNNAKTVFTEFLEQAEFFEIYCKNGRLESGETIESVIERLFTALSELNNNFFKIHGNDVDLQALQEKTREKLSVLDALFTEHRTRFTGSWLETTIDSNLSACRKK